jgi:hypothetical protein
MKKLPLDQLGPHEPSPAMLDFGALLPWISEENPFMGPFAHDYFNGLGVSTDFNRPLTAISSTVRVALFSGNKA